MGCPHAQAILIRTQAREIARETMVSIAALATRKLVYSMGRPVPLRSRYRAGPVCSEFGITSGDSCPEDTDSIARFIDRPALRKDCLPKAISGTRMVIFDPLYGEFVLPPHLEELMLTPEVRRLSQIRLLNTLTPSLATLGELRRYSHTLGVLYLCSQNPLRGYSEEE